jgi:hypothetical protein
VRRGRPTASSTHRARAVVASGYDRSIDVLDRDDDRPAGVVEPSPAAFRPGSPGNAARRHRDHLAGRQGARADLIVDGLLDRGALGALVNLGRDRAGGRASAIGCREWAGLVDDPLRAGEARPAALARGVATSSGAAAVAPRREGSTTSSTPDGSADRHRRPSRSPSSPGPGGGRRRRPSPSSSPAAARLASLMRPRPSWCAPTAPGGRHRPRGAVRDRSGWGPARRATAPARPDQRRADGTRAPEPVEAWDETQRLAASGASPTGPCARRHELPDPEQEQNTTATVAMTMPAMAGTRGRSRRSAWASRGPKPRPPGARRARP